MPANRPKPNPRPRFLGKDRRNWSEIESAKRIGRTSNIATRPYKKIENSDLSLNIGAGLSAYRPGHAAKTNFKKFALAQRNRLN